MRPRRWKMTGPGTLRGLNGPGSQLRRGDPPVTLTRDPPAHALEAGLVPVGEDAAVEAIDADNLREALREVRAERDTLHARGLELAERHRRLEADHQAMAHAHELLLGENQRLGERVAELETLVEALRKEAAPTTPRPWAALDPAERVRFANFVRGASAEPFAGRGAPARADAWLGAVAEDVLTEAFAEFSAAPR